MCVLHIYSKSIDIDICLYLIYFLGRFSLGSKPRQVPYLTGELLLYLMMGWAVVLAWDSWQMIFSAEDCVMCPWASCVLVHM